ncbi:20498_t:CDS:2, partial [Gigaspora margarita]
IDVIIHDDITSICLILTPLQGPFFSLRLHLSVNIPEEYPYILKDNNQSSRRYNGGYTAGYLLKYIFLQLLSFFSDQWVEQVGSHLYNIITDKNFKLRVQQIVQKYSCSNCGYNKPICANPIKVVLTDNEINNQDIYGNHDPSIILKMIPRMMNLIVVNLMKACDDSSGHTKLTCKNLFLKASEKALQGYCLLFHLLIKLSEKYPEITKEAINKVLIFMNSEEKRFIIYLFLCKNIVWSEFCPYFLEELLAHNVVWFLNKNPDLAYIELNDYHSKYQLDTTFELSNTSLCLILFQVSFLKIMQGIEENIKRRYGYPSDEMIRFFLPEQNWEQVVSKMLKDAINKSFHNGYHQVQYTVNELYFIRYKYKSQIPPLSNWDENSEEAKK